MGLTRTQMETRILRTIKDSSLSTEAADWIDEVLDLINGLGYWRFLVKTTTHQTVNNQQSVLFSASEFPAAAITDYFGGLSVVSSLDPYKLEMIPKIKFDGLTPETGAPTKFALEGGEIGSEKLFLHPTPITGGTTLPLLTLSWYKPISQPTAGADDFQTDLKIPRIFNPIIMNGARAIGLFDVGDNRSEVMWQKFIHGLAALAVTNNDYFNFEASQIDRSSLLDKILGLSMRAVSGG